MTRRALLILLIIFLSALFFFKDLFFSPAVCFRSSCLWVEEARTPDEQARGLMFRKHLDQKRGMIFVFPSDEYWSFWMKNTYIPLDLFWLDKDKRVVDIVENARPAHGENLPSFKPAARSRYVLETNAGFAARHKVRIGDQARFWWIFSRSKI